MLSSLPLIIPYDADDLWYHPSTQQLPPHHQTHLVEPSLHPSAAAAADGAGFPTPRRILLQADGNTLAGGMLSHHHQHHHHSNGSTSSSSILTHLRQSENFVTQRKLNIQRFGASWIRPPGVGKTFQAAMDEAAEREEQERSLERNAGMSPGLGAGDVGLVEGADDATAAAVLAGLQAGSGGGGGDGAEGQMGAGAVGEEAGLDERDLDDDVPEAEEDALEDEDEEDEGEGEDDVGEDFLGLASEDIDLTVPDPDPAFGLQHGRNQEANTIAIMEAQEDMVVEHDEHLLPEGAAQERDLDDSIPEAGSYQHTDTELEDNDDD